MAREFYNIESYRNNNNNNNSSQSNQKNDDLAKRKKEEKEKRKKEEERQRRIENQKNQERRMINSSFDCVDDAFDEISSKLSKVYNILSEDIVIDSIGFRVDEIKEIKKKLK